MLDQTHPRAMRLLIIEDESLIAFELRDLLEDLGHEVLGMAAAISDALSLLEEFAGQIDAVMLDANLGGEPSTRVAEALRDAGVPFVVTSGYEPEELERLGLTGAHVVKPYTRADIHRTLAAI